jgi:hypothetical protein
MADVEPRLRLIRFGDFEVDLRTGELLKAGAKQKLGIGEQWNRKLA